MPGSHKKFRKPWVWTRGLCGAARPKMEESRGNPVVGFGHAAFQPRWIHARFSLCRDHFLVRAGRRQCGRSPRCRDSDRPRSSGMKSRRRVRPPRVDRSPGDIPMIKTLRIAAFAAAATSIIFRAATCRSGAADAGFTIGTTAATAGGGSPAAIGISIRSRSIPIRTMFRRPSSCSRRRRCRPACRRRRTGITATIPKAITPMSRPAARRGARFRQRPRRKHRLRHRRVRRPVVHNSICQGFARTLAASAR